MQNLIIENSVTIPLEKYEGMKAEISSLKSELITVMKENEKKTIYVPSVHKSAEIISKAIALSAAIIALGCMMGFFSHL